MTLSADSTDDTVLTDIGARIEAARLALNRTQADVAHEAGVSKRTLERIEAGHSAQLTSFIRILRALDLLDRLEDALPPAEPGPMDLLRGGGEPPERASRARGSPDDGPWQWGDEG